MKKVCGILFCLAFLSCQNDKNSKNDTQEKIDFYENKVQVDTIFIQQLSKPASEVAMDWNAYVALQSEINRMKNFSISEVLNNTDNIIRISDSLQKSIPDPLQKRTVNSRLKLIETQAKRLKQLLHFRSQDSSKINESIYKLVQGYSSLNIQINEIYIETPNFEFQNEN
ncbi:hypothetical protein [Psychroflexus halocasei]|uniref:Uncharacterized protein n=1 Tax=Psychroflexus halocasei TaxID=908615 RepID=A0A1H3VZ31_9FLAO|nr:hypothetical protein [Psychroflexus halocasei]SDZ80066.1 hypothetical protein SAMN05421540_101350 [Psychroflexus halocasei]